MPIGSLASVRIVNAVVEGGVIKLNDNIRDSALNFNSKLFSVNTGNVPMYIYRVSDSLHPYFYSNKNLMNGDVYSLYIWGESSKTVNASWVKEDFAPYYTDSAFGIRFVNLCVNSPLLSFTVASDTTVSLFSDIGEMKYTAFVKLPLKKVVPTGAVTFQARTADKKIIASYTLPASASSLYRDVSIQLSRYKRITIVVRGLNNGNVGMFPVANY